MQEYMQSQKEKWEKEKSSSPHSHRKEPGRSKSPSAKPTTPDHKPKTPEKEKQRPPSSPHTTPPTTPKSKPSPSAKNTNEISKSANKTSKIQQGEALIHDIVQAWHSSYLYSIKHSETKAETERYITVWSKPTANTPIPEFTANIYFVFQPSNKKPLSYTIEDNKYIHSLDNGVGFREEWVDAVIEGKRAAQEALYQIKV